MDQFRWLIARPEPGFSILRYGLASKISRMGRPGRDRGAFWGSPLRITLRARTDSKNWWMLTETILWMVKLDFSGVLFQGNPDFDLGIGTQQPEVFPLPVFDFYLKKEFS